ncbi:MAG: EpsG family protein [Bacteroides sp.]
MLIYLLIITLFALLAFGDVFRLIPKRLYSSLWILCFCLLIFHDGFRWETGTDWVNYSNYFENCLDIEDSDFEVGYATLCMLIRLLTSEYTVFLIVYSVALYFLIALAISSYAINPFLSLFYYYCTSLPLLGMNRQFIALGFCLLSIKYIASRKPLLFCLFVGLASFFHLSALMFLIAYFLNKPYTSKFYLIILLIALGISMSGIMAKLPLNYLALLEGDVVYKLQYYADDFLSGNVHINPVFVLLSLSKRLIWIVLILLFVYNAKKEDTIFVTVFNIYFFALLFYIVLNNTILQIFVSRGLLYYNIAEIFIIPYALLAFKMNYGKVLMFLLLILYGITNLKKGLDSYAPPGGSTDLFIPYKGVFINTDYNRKDH